MNFPLMLDYHTEHGTSKIRSFHIDGNLYISLEDVVLTLAKSNSANNDFKAGLGALINAQAAVLDADECRNFSIYGNNDFSSRQETFITEPGLYRIISRDKTPASKAFQRWIFHEVLPSIRKFGTYPAPLNDNNSEIMLLAQSLAQHTNLLIKEICERERLAAETKKRFIETERQLSEIHQKIDTLSLPNAKSGLTRVSAYCKENKVAIDLKHLRAMCAKLCLEQNIEFEKDLESTMDMDYRYPASLIAEAIRLITR